MARLDLNVYGLYIYLNQVWIQVPLCASPGNNDGAQVLLNRYHNDVASYEL